MARRKISYKVPPFRQLNPFFGAEQIQQGGNNMFSSGFGSNILGSPGNIAGNAIQSAQQAAQGFQPTVIRNETSMNANNNYPQSLGNPMNPDGSAFNKQKAMFPDQTKNNFGLIDPVQAQAAAPQMPIANPEIDSNVIDSSMEVATGKDMSQPIVDQNPQNKLEQLYKLS